METCGLQLDRHLSRCRDVLSKGYASSQSIKLSWLNMFCLEFLKLLEVLRKFLFLVNERESKDCHCQVEIVYLCLTQIVTCVKHLEKTIQVEQAKGTAIPASRQHFRDRIHWCLDRLSVCVKTLKFMDVKKCNSVEERTFVDLMDMLLDQLSPYSSYKDERDCELAKESIDVAEDQAQAQLVSKQIRPIVDVVLSHTLAFANVALKEDKKALSALCQKVLRECIAFQEECFLGLQTGASTNYSIRKIKAISLENALYQLEDYIHESLLRLVYTCFLDYNKLSVEKLRGVIESKDLDDPELDDLIADFDVNIDRTTQIGVFAIAFAPDVKIKTVVRSCLASFESLDSCIIPALQSKFNADVYAQLLEQHFNEEVAIFKQAIQEIIDSHAFSSCYHELLTQTINSNDKNYNKQSLQNIIAMGNFLREHFQLSVNQKELHKEGERMELFKKFSLMLNECQAVIKCSEEEHIEKSRILKRFKILRSVLGKFTDALGGIPSDGNPFCSNKSQAFIMSEDADDSQQMFASIGILPSVCSILYDNSPTIEGRRRQRLPSDSLKANYSKLAVFSPITGKAIRIPITNKSNSQIMPPHPAVRCFMNAAGPQNQRFNIRRKESLRTTMFKRQKSYEAKQICEDCRDCSSSLQISEIIDQLTGLSTKISESFLD